MTSSRLAAQIRLRAVKMVAPHGFGYLGQALSSAELLAALFAGPYRADHDTLVCSPGHYIIGVFAAAARAGHARRPSAGDLRPGRLGAGGDRDRAIPGRGSHLRIARQGLSAAPASPCPTGCAATPGPGVCPRSAMASSRRGRSGRRQCSPRTAGRRLVVLLDANDSQVDGPVSSITTMEPIAAKWASFGWTRSRWTGTIRRRSARRSPPRSPAAPARRHRADIDHARPGLPARRMPTVTSSSSLRRWPGRPSRNWRPGLLKPPYPTVLKPYGRALVELARERPEIVCLSGDLTRQCEVDLFEARYRTGSSTPGWPRPT